MKIKRFFAPDIRQAIRQVREQLGPDAVILSNNRVDGGVEIVSAIDYDESLVGGIGGRNTSSLRSEKDSMGNESTEEELTGESDAEVRPHRGSRLTPSRGIFPANKKQAVVWSQEPTLVEMRRELNAIRGLLENQLSDLAWNEMVRRFPLRAELLQRLIKMGLSTSLCREFASEITSADDIKAAWHQVLGLLAQRIPVMDDDILTKGGVVALVGPTGVGKTTTIAKLAARYALRHGARHVSLITIDNYRIGAHEQLRSYGRILDIPVRAVSNQEQLGETLEDLSDKRLVLIDTAGMSQRDLRTTEQLKMLSRNNQPINIYLLLSAVTRLSVLQETIDAFSKVGLNGSIITKLDEATSLGAAISAVIKNGLPVAYLSDGQRVPEDMHLARVNDIVSRSVEIMKNSKTILEEELSPITISTAANSHV